MGQAMGQANTSRRGGEVDSKVLRELEYLGSCNLDELISAVPQYTWFQVFAAVNRLSQEGAVILRHPSRFETRFEYVGAVGIRRA